MPTAGEFTAAAAEFDALNIAVRAQMLAVDADAIAATMSPSLARDRARAAADLIVDELRSVTAQLMMLEAECRRRALVCLAYEAAFDDFERRYREWEASGSDARPPWQPTRPAPWAERS